MKKLFFLLMLAIVGIANAKAQKPPVNTKVLEKESSQKGEITLPSSAKSEPEKISPNNNSVNNTQLKTKVNASPLQSDQSVTNAPNELTQKKIDKKPIPTQGTEAPLKATKRNLEIKHPPMQDSGNVKQ